MPYRIRPCQKIRGDILLAGDKSISHRAIILSSLAQGTTYIKNFGYSDDCIATINAMRALGVCIKKVDARTVKVIGVGRDGLRKPKGALFVGESGTTMRILCGLLCAQKFPSVITGKPSLLKRPMARITVPLRQMGAHIKGKKKKDNEYPPLHITPASLRAICWKMNVASAQVKSALMLAGLYARGCTRIHEPFPSRDHTERMLCLFKASIALKARSISIKQSHLESPQQLTIPADVSSAAFFVVLACLRKGSRIRIRDLVLNPTRFGAIEVLKKMGARIRIVNKPSNNFEPVGDIIVQSSRLRAVEVSERDIPRLIDELPILMVAAAFAKGETVFKGAGELRVKETDRVYSMAENLSKMGVSIEIKHKANKELIVIHGNENLWGASFCSFGDHRTAMSMIIAGLCADSPSSIDNTACIAKSFPNFFDYLKHLVVS